MMIPKMIQEEKTGIADFFEREGLLLHVRRGSFLFHQLDQTDSLFFVASGRFVVSRETAEGKQFYLSVVNEGQLIGDFSLFENFSEQSFSAKALEQQCVCCREKQN
jgi:CRP/FNR family transcriptional regulator